MILKPRNAILFLILSCQLFFLQAPLYAGPEKQKAQVYFNNGDKVSGEVVFEDRERIEVKNNLIGTLSIKKSGVKEIIYGEAKKDAPVEEKKDKKKSGPWSGDVSVGYDRLGGNTKESDLAIRILLNRKTWNDEFTIKGEMFYSSASGKMDAQKWYNMVRYARSFYKRKWYNFYKIENDHDRFANISYRLVPSLGMGYWFSDSERLKLVLELGVGLQHTEYRLNAKDSDEAIILPRVMFEKALFAKSRLTQDLALYPYLTEAGKYRLHSETAFINPINDCIALRLSFIDDYDSEPTGDAKKNDYRFITALSYSF